MMRGHSVDLGFLQRLYRTTLVVGGLVTLVLCATANGKWVVNYALGVLISIGFLKVTELFVTQTYCAPQEAPPQTALGGGVDGRQVWDFAGGSLLAGAVALS
jgi:alpha-D-ribose 1-methylphosphonate 5-triphosphate synthase subunit PhnI